MTVDRCCPDTCQSECGENGIYVLLCYSPIVLIDNEVVDVVELNGESHRTHNRNDAPEHTDSTAFDKRNDR